MSEMRYELKAEDGDLYVRFRFPGSGWWLVQPMWVLETASSERLSAVISDAAVSTATFDGEAWPEGPFLHVEDPAGPRHRFSIGDYRFWRFDRDGSGWPTCCDLTMTWWTQRQVDASEAPPREADDAR